MSILADMIDFIENNNITHYHTFLQYCVKYKPAWALYLSTKSYSLIQYFKSRNHYAKLIYEGTDMERYCEASKMADDYTCADVEKLKNKVDQKKKKSDNKIVTEDTNS